MYTQQSRSRRVKNPMAIRTYIEKNPFRVLGTCANATIRERNANTGRIAAFLRVGKSVSFPLDLVCRLPAVPRTPKFVAQAESELSFLQNRIRWAQFWFLDATATDHRAIGMLAQGNFAGAVELWRPGRKASEMHNKMLCALIEGRASSAATTARALYGSRGNPDRERELVTLLGGNAMTDFAKLSAEFFVALSGGSPDWAMPFLCAEKDAKTESAVRALISSSKAFPDSIVSARELLQKAQPLLSQVNAAQRAKLADDVAAVALRMVDGDDFANFRTKLAALDEIAKLDLSVAFRRDKLASARAGIQKAAKLAAEKKAADAVRALISEYGKRPGSIVFARELLQKARSLLSQVNAAQRAKLADDVAAVALRMVDGAGFAFFQTKSAALNEIAKLDLSAVFRRDKLAPTRDRIKRKAAKSLIAVTVICAIVGFGLALMFSLPARDDYSAPTMRYEAGIATNLSRGAPAEFAPQAPSVEPVASEAPAAKSIELETPAESRAESVAGTISNAVPAAASSVRPATGAKPYAKYFDSGARGTNRIRFYDGELSGDDYVVIVRDATSNRFVDHIYVRADEFAELLLPNGTFNFFVYSGKYWSETKAKGTLAGGFLSDEHIHKDGPISFPRGNNTTFHSLHSKR